jgi:hypothetical protein
MPNPFSQSLDRTAARLPLQYRVLCHLFLLRVIDLEALSIKADVTAFLGQFSGILIMFSLILSAMAVMNSPTDTEESLFFLTTLAVGLITVITWDNTFPDRRDVLVLAPLPVKPRTILAAKITASSAVLALAVLAINALPSLAVAISLGPGYNIFRSFAFLWIALLALVLVLYASVLTLQGFAALLLPRRIFLRLSALLQILAFAYFLCGFFMLPSLPVGAMSLPIAHNLVAFTPTFWFYALCLRLNGVLPTSLTWLSTRAELAVILSTAGAATSLLLSYLHTLRKTVEEPDLVPAARGSHRSIRFGSPLTTVVLLFSLRALTRSRQHRLAFAFYLSIVFAIALGTLKFGLLAPAPHLLTEDFLLNTILMMSFAVIGLRSVFSLPISLNANWVLRITQLRPTPEYTAATRTTLIVLAVAPVLGASAILSATYRPLSEVAAHLLILLLLGTVLAELSLIGFYKVPFTCSYLPGKSNVQFIFWGFLVLFIPLAMQFVSLEQRAFTHLAALLVIIGSLIVLLIAIQALNHRQATSAAIYFEELPAEVLTTLKLSGN